MPKVHSIGKQHFVQFIDFPVVWGWKLYSIGWTQEISPPFRTTNKAVIVRLPFHKALVFGKWSGVRDEAQALEQAIQGRVLKDEDFEEGWTPAAYKIAGSSFEDWDV